MQVQQNVNDLLFEIKVDLIAASLPIGYSKCLKEGVSQDDALVICNYISMETEINLSDNYRGANIILLAKLLKFFKGRKSYNQITREDVLSFLDGLRKPETLDLLHK